MSVAFSAVWMLFSTGFGVSFDQYRRTSAKAEVSRLMIHLARELRQTTSLSSAQAAELTFVADTDKDGTDETIQYTWNGTAGQPLNRMEASVTLPFVNSVSNLSLTYYDSSNTELSFPVTLSQVKLVTIDLTVTDGDEIFNLRNRIKLASL